MSRSRTPRAVDAEWRPSRRHGIQGDQDPSRDLKPDKPLRRTYSRRGAEPGEVAVIVTDSALGSLALAGVDKAVDPFADGEGASVPIPGEVTMGPNLHNAIYAAALRAGARRAAEAVQALEAA